MNPSTPPVPAARAHPSAAVQGLQAGPDRPSQARPHRGQRAVRRLLEYAPASGSLALWAEHRDLEAPPCNPQPDEGAAARREAALRRRELRFLPLLQEPQPLAEPPAFTDGRTLYYLPSFDSLPIEQQTGWVAHEVLHLALRHVQRLRALRARLGDVDALLFNRCADAIVNSSLSHLSWLALPDGALTLPVLLSEVLGVEQGEEAALGAWDVERLYRAVDDRRASRRGLPRDERQQPGGSSAERPTSESARADGPRSARLRQLASGIPRDLADAAETTAAPEPPEAEAALAREWAERLLRGHVGDGAFSMLRALPAGNGRATTPWEALLRSRLNRALAPQAALSWSRPARSWTARQGRGPGGTRLPFAPGIVGSRLVPRLVLVVDLSGSIDEALLARFACEVEALVRLHRAALTLVLGDDAVRRVLHHDPGRRRLDLAALRVEGGGGTDFAPLIAEALRHRPDLVVLLTDLDGPCGTRPAVPVLWAVPPPPQGRAMPEAPFGRVMRVG